MTITMYGIRNCDTIKKARAWLDGHGVAYTFHDYAVSGIDRARLAAWAREVGWERLCNRSGTTYRKLPDVEKADLTESRALDLMAAHPSLIRRPVVAIGDGSRETLVVGFSPESYARLPYAT